ncbi:anthranilate synthase component I family protein [Paenibacillus sp. GD4]|uniref:anthranilate synthase component I family protein n=1 Tax=Paenibacillus sp. GD4 TaxID=3068890 RepID=UPI002796C888|nr:anthranilate synthase component I family protein [Paenibacillus sp. GD4]MDQ1910921.1 anthranilate synthase component I family protein [Paenibacillus sp. GD4]
MILTTYEDWLRWSRTYSVLPLVIKHSLPQDRLISWQRAWEEASTESFVLESGKGGRYTFLGLKASSVIRGTDRRAAISDSDGTLSMADGKPLDLVKEWMAPYRSPRVEGAPKWIGGCIGFWGYDVIRTIEKLPSQAKADLPVPDYAFLRVDELWVLDHQENQLYCAVHHANQPETGPDEERLRGQYELALQQAQRMKELWDRLAGIQSDRAAQEAYQDKLESVAKDRMQIDVESIPGIVPDFTKESYMAAVRRIQEYIGAGDVFQVNLSVRQHKKLSQSPEEIYEWLRVVNPSPYMGLLRFGDFHLVSGSPELLVQLERGKVRTRPIAGTRPRGRNEEEDRELANELILHEKERAEHIMLVDLERNDLGRISNYGTVRVKDFMVIEYYSHVMHIVSEVEGELAPGKDAYDVIAATFPGGTITGAPKIRTMQIIEELEPVRRGPYTGSIGWIDYNGDMEFNIVIRTLVAAGDTGYVQAGAGIVIDSVPEREYIESINKAKAMWKAIQYSELHSCATGGM